MAYTDHLSEDEKEGIKKFIREYEELFVTEEWRVKTVTDKIKKCTGCKYCIKENYGIIRKILR
jgi:Pyruvate/2-oxoacid:ferredoxin oxidoreductase delta subunit